MAYSFRDDIAIADLAVEIKAADLDELFKEGAMALEKSMVDTNFEVDIKKNITLSADSIDLLFYDWLAELTFLKDTEGFVFNKFDIEVSENGHLRAAAYGTRIGNTSEKKLDVKAVTMHNFRVEKTKKGWEALVVFDI